LVLKSFLLPTKFNYMFRMVLATNSELFPEQHESTALL
jgi:hypothetical protein